MFSHSLTLLVDHTLLAAEKGSPRSKTHGWMLRASPTSVVPLPWSETITSTCARPAAPTGVAVATGAGAVAMAGAGFTPGTGVVAATGAGFSAGAGVVAAIGSDVAGDGVLSMTGSSVGFAAGAGVGFADGAGVAFATGSGLTAACPAPVPTPTLSTRLTMAFGSFEVGLWLTSFASTS